jgi:hypothetical protein
VKLSLHTAPVSQPYPPSISGGKTAAVGPGAGSQPTPLLFADVLVASDTCASPISLYVLRVAHDGDVQRGTMESSKIFTPSAQHRIDPASDVVNFEVCPPIESLFSDRIAYLTRRFATDGRTEADKEVTLRAFDTSRTKSVAEKVKLRVRMLLSPVTVPAVDDLRLLRMQFQSAFAEAFRKFRLQFRGLLFCSAVTDRIIGITLEGNVEMFSLHPQDRDSRAGSLLRARRRRAAALTYPPAGAPTIRSGARSRRDRVEQQGVRQFNHAGLRSRGLARSSRPRVVLGRARTWQSRCRQIQTWHGSGLRHERCRALGRADRCKATSDNRPTDLRGSSLAAAQFA